MYDVKLVSVAQNIRKETGWSIRKIASIMNISKSTIGRWLTTTRDTEKKIGRPRIEIQVNELFPRFQYSSLRTMVREASLNCSITTLCRRLKESKITKKNIKHCIKFQKFWDSIFFLLFTMYFKKLISVPKNLHRTTWYVRRIAEYEY